MQSIHSCVAASLISQRSIGAYIGSEAHSAANFEGTTSMFISRFIRLLRSWWRYNESVAELARLSDRELADIGVSRSEITAIAWQNARAST
jgi:uncharacterized protein YjiS (DUF1127 family)